MLSQNTFLHSNTGTILPPDQPHYKSKLRIVKEDGDVKGSGLAGWAVLIITVLTDTKGQVHLS